MFFFCGGGGGSFLALLVVVWLLVFTTGEGTHRTMYCRLLSSSFSGLLSRILHTSQNKELLRSLWVYTTSQ